MSRKRKTIPDFENEAEERAFREANDYIDWSQAERARLVNLRPSTKEWVCKRN